MRFWIVVGLAIMQADAPATPERSPSAADSGRVAPARLVVTGSAHISAGRIGELLRAPDGAEALRREYAAAGYWWAVVEDSTFADRSPDEGLAGNSATASVRLVRVSEGARATIETEDASARLGGPEDVLLWIEQRLMAEARSGHPLAAIELHSAREPGGGRVVLRANVTRGPLVTVGRVRPIGNTITRSIVIERELRQESGAAYDQRRVDRWRRRLERTGYFEEVGEPSMVWSDSSRGVVDLAIRVSEGRPNRFEGVVGYQPATEGRPSQVTGLVDIALGNLWGTGRRVDARWERPREETSLLDLAYREPWVAGYPVDASVALAVEQRIGYAVEQIEGRLGGEAWPSVTAGIGIGRRVVRSDSILALAGPRNRGTTFSAEVDYDTRDVRLNPTRGMRYHVDWRSSFRTNGVNDSDFVAVFGIDAWPKTERSSSVRVDLEHYVPVGRASVVALGWHGAQVVSDDGRASISRADSLRIGGVQTVRGYRQDQFMGDRLAWGNHEWRYLLGPMSRAFAFVDAGVVRMHRQSTVAGEAGPTTTSRATRWLLGYGIGLRARTRAGVLGIDFGWGRGDSFGQGKVHVRLESVF